MNVISKSPLGISEKTKLEGYFKDWDNNEEIKKECLVYLFENVLDAEEIKTKALSPILERLGHLLVGEKELKKNLKSLESLEAINELTEEWLEDNIEGCLDEKMKVEAILAELSEHLQTFLKVRVISEIKTGIALAQ